MDINTCYFETIVFMQGEEAEKPLGILRDQGAAAAADYLAQWDQGDALPARKGTPWGNSDTLYPLSGRLYLSVNPGLEYISLARRLLRSEEPQPVES